MTWKTELGVAGAAIVAAAGAWLFANPVAYTQSASASSSFTEHDYAQFDRAFSWNGNECAIGDRRNGDCYRSSPLEQEVHVGRVLPKSVPAMSASVAMVMEMSPKRRGLETYRYGQTLALVDMRTRTVVDKLDLSQGSYAAAQGHGIEFAGGDDLRPAAN